jgi:hypothetical protein
MKYKYLACLATILLLTSFTYASSTATINATIKINVCGDGIPEGGEECDLTDFAGKSCTTLGYDEGSLICDPSCSIDKSLCTINPKKNEDKESNSTTVTTPSSNIDGHPGTYTRVFEVAQLPSILKIFDENGDNKIKIEELENSAKKWFQAWKGSLKTNRAPDECDLNTDARCNLEDFSVLMYYIDR